MATSIRIPYLKRAVLELQRRGAAGNIPFATAAGMDLFCEPARGGVDFEAFRDVLSDRGQGSERMAAYR